MHIFDSICESTITNIEFDFLNSILLIDFEHRSTSKKRRLIASGVVEFVGWDFRFSNIVQEITVYSDSDSSSDEVRSLVFGALSGRDSKTDKELHSHAIDKILRNISEGQLKIASLDAVFGSEMIILAGKFELLNL